MGAQRANSAYHRRVPFPSELGNSTSRQLQSMQPSLIVPIGSTEQHGPHLPLDTDTRIAEAVSRSVAAQLGETTSGAAQRAWLVGSAISYGASGEHESFPGTISIGLAALEHLMVEFGRSACNWARRVVFVNGHGGNVAALTAATKLLRFEGRDVAWVPCAAAGADAHAGHTETSVLLHLSPADVWLDESVVGNTAPLSELLPALRRGGVAAVSPVGVLGDPTTATAAEGSRIFGEMVGSCVRRISAWQPGPGGMLA
ncbi:MULTISPECIES: mycofactocin biosynthesis peptidyl-dipeptidase MftE [unclassified Mycolicibacterium]|uniref:mycofactocin biosynthesis peptidyl-dipeptidase MftE n=1 Tax=unclassified Mycolicibacterium TaxID=2636767 RepID=UPI0028160B27|nr:MULTISPECIES: mycofactocin biosynthesis peptidyl-dipeptidase MftE [unclassified Mycolicibacterium]MUM05442.1 mycofactocin biosynthesis peptidyl-dipeptidase MftE [Mycolicibacterium sp. CBMA 213]